MATAIVNKYGIAFNGLAHLEGPGVDWKGLNGELLFYLEKKSMTSTDKAIWEFKPGGSIPVAEIMSMLERYGFDVVQGSDNYDDWMKTLSSGL
ncbi:MAG: hypothetical protein WAM91_08990 [Candidatus Acidiferrales bacterium]